MSTETVPQAIDYTPLGLFANTYTVTRTHQRELPPVLLSIAATRGGFNVQDYLTPDDADRLADALKATAARVRAEA